MTPIDKADQAADRAHVFWMRQALNLAERGLGQVAPNPAIGCVIVKTGRLIARGWTQPGGRPHAEHEALARAGADAKGADIYVTLEPCAHHGETPPCADALIEAGVARVICAQRDPDLRVNGRGIKKLRAANIEVIEDVLHDEAAFLNAGYLLHRRLMRPLVTLKIAATLDGRIAAASGESRWITSPAARRQAHWLRASHDAVMVGSRTSLHDNPELTCRLPGLGARSPVRIVADSHLSINLASKLVQTAARYPLWILCRKDADPDRREALEASGARLFETRINPDSGLMDIHAALGILAAENITRLLVEGGAQLAASFLREDYVDRIYWFSAPSMIGGDGRAAIAGMGFAHLDDIPHFRTLWTQSLLAEAAGDDRLTILERVRPKPPKPNPRNPMYKTHA